VEGVDVPFGPRVTAVAGKLTLKGNLPDVVSGSYELRVLTTDGIDRVLSAPKRIQVKGMAPRPSPSLSPAPATPSSSATPAVAVPSAPAAGRSPVLLAVPAASAALVAGLAAVLVVRRRRARDAARRHHGAPG
jgi:hypothetical protein